MYNKRDMHKYLNILYLLFLTVPMAAQQTAPDSVVARCPLDTVDGQVMYRYTVDKSVGLYRVSKIFNVPQESIIEANPDLRTRGLRYGEMILIPTGEKAVPAHRTAQTAQEIPVSVAVPEKQEQAQDAVAANMLTADSIGVTSTDTVPDTDSTGISLQDKERLHLSLLLPFQVHNTKRDQAIDRFMEFYEGCLLAAYDLQAEGMPLALDVIDTEKGSTIVRELADSNRLAHSQAVIGLAYPMQLLQMAPWAAEHRIPILAPFCGQMEGVENNPYLYFFNSSAAQEAKRMGDWLEAHRDSINCILIDAKDADIPTSIRLIRKEIAARGIPHTTTSIRHILNDSVQQALRDSVENILLFNTEKYGNVQMLIPRILQNKGGHHVSLLGQYSWTREAIPLPMVYTSLFATADTVNTSDYEMLYERYFGHEHTSETPRYDMLGYDMLRTMVAILSDTTYHGLQSDVHFEQLTPEGVFVNTNVQVVHTGR